MAKCPSARSRRLRTRALHRGRTDAAVAADEAARTDRCHRTPCPEAGRRRAVTVGWLLHEAVDLRTGDGTSSSCRPVRTNWRGHLGNGRERVEQQPRRANAIAGDDDDQPAGTARCHPCRNRRRSRPCRARWSDFAHAANEGLELDACTDRVRPIGDVGRSLSPAQAGVQWPRLCSARGLHSPRSQPWCPMATSASRACSSPCRSADRRVSSAVRHRRLGQRRKRIARQARYAHHAVVL